MKHKYSLLPFVSCVNEIGSIIDVKWGFHQKQVAYMCFMVGQLLRLNREELAQLVYAALIHDLGVFNNDTDTSFHAQVASEWLIKTDLFKDLSLFVQNHHVFSPQASLTQQILYAAELICSHLYKKLDFIMKSFQVNPGHNPDATIKLQHETLNLWEEKLSLDLPPILINAFTEIMLAEAFWFNFTSYKLEIILRHLLINLDSKSQEISLLQLDSFANLLLRILYYWDKETVFHSFNVAATAEILAKALNFDKDKIGLIKIAGLTHDLGKVVISPKILNRKKPLTEKQLFMIKSHSYYTFRILGALYMYPDLITWAAYHHERLDGNGYPFHLNKNSLSIGSQILTLADIYSALTEDRPYRNSLPLSRAFEILESISGKQLNPDLIALARKYSQEIEDNKTALALEAKRLGFY